VERSRCYEESDAQLTFRESITFGSGCCDQGIVELTDQSANELIYRWHADETTMPAGCTIAVGSVRKVE
jgi:hypothetical protein